MSDLPGNLTTKKTFRHFRTGRPVCPHCGHEMTHEQMANYREADLFEIATEESIEPLTCVICQGSFWVQGGYDPHYTTAVEEDDL